MNAAVIAFIVGVLVGGATIGAVQQHRINSTEQALKAKTELIEGEMGLNAQIVGLVAAKSKLEADLLDLNNQIEQITAEARATQQITLELLDEAERRADATELKMQELRRKRNESQKPTKAVDPITIDAVNWGLCRTREISAGGDPNSC